MVTHDQEEAMSMADRIAVLRDGRLEQLATPQELYARPATRFVASFIGTANMLDGVATASGVDVERIGSLPAGHAIAPGSPAAAVIRPEQVEVTRGDTGIRGIVADTYFLGGASTLAIDVEGLPAPILSAVHGTTDLVRGDVVSVRFLGATAVELDTTEPASHGTTIPTTAIRVGDQ